MIKVTIERGSVTEVIYVDSVESIAKVSETLMKSYIHESTEVMESMERIDNRVNEMGYDSLDEALNELTDFKEEREELLEIQEKYENLDRTADTLGYSSVDEALDAIDEMKSAMSDIYDIADQWR